VGVRASGSASRSSIQTSDSARRQAVSGSDRNPGHPATPVSGPYFGRLNHFFFGGVGEGKRSAVNGAWGSVALGGGGGGSFSAALSAGAVPGSLPGELNRLEGGGPGCSPSGPASRMSLTMAADVA